jgi:hypothetical protein
MTEEQLELIEDDAQCYLRHIAEGGRSSFETPCHSDVIKAVAEIRKLRVALSDIAERRTPMVTDGTLENLVKTLNTENCLDVLGLIADRFGDLNEHERMVQLIEWKYSHSSFEGSAFMFFSYTSLLIQAVIRGTC